MNDLLLSEKEIKKIHCASIDILERIGIKLLHDELLRYIASFEGIKIDVKNKIVRFQPDIIEDSIKNAVSICSYV